MDALTKPVRQIIDPQQNTEDKQAKLMEEQEKRDGQVKQPGTEGGSVRDPVTGEQMVRVPLTNATYKVPTLSTEDTRRHRQPGGGTSRRECVNHGVSST